MLWLINVILLVFVLGMAFLWATYGLFSALIQLGIVIAAGAIAFAVWEPLAAVLLGRMPAMAWGVALLAPFVLLLIGLRVASDKLVKANVQTNNLLNQAGGAVVGAAAGYLAAGIALLGIAHLPMGEKILGYQPFQAAGFTTEASPDADLWTGLQADRTASAFFTTLSAGAFSPTLSDASLATHRPNPYEAAHRTRLGPDPAAATTVAPDAVEVLGLVTASPSTEELRQMVGFAAFDALLSEPPADDLDNFQVIPTIAQTNLGSLRTSETLNQLGKGYGDEKGNPVQLRDMLDAMAADLVERAATNLAPQLAGGRQLLIVPTRWTRSPTSFDIDSRLRINPTQARLYYTTKGDALEAAPPLAVSRFTPVRGGRVLLSFAETSQVAGSNDTEELAFVFAIPGDAKPTVLMLRNLRFDLPEAKPLPPLETARLIGAPPFAETSVQETTAAVASSASGIEGVSFSTTSRLPRAISPNSADASLRRNADDTRLQSGEGFAPKAPGRAMTRTIDVPAGDGMVRMEITPRVAQSFLGGARDVAARIQPVQLIDTFGRVYDPIAYVIAKKDGSQYIGINPSRYRSPSQMQLNRLTNDDQFFVYFQVQANTKITEVVFGVFREGQRQTLPEPLEVPEDNGR
ncbi:MAG: hypothetical protein AAGI68_14845 [Planctomycetota bacterium]